MNEEIWRVKDGDYNQKNYYWSSWGIKDLIAGVDEKDRKRLAARVEALRKNFVP